MELKEDLNYQIVVMSAVRYALDRKTYVPASVAEFIATNYNTLDNKTKFCIRRDVREKIRSFTRTENNSSTLSHVNIDLMPFERICKRIDTDIGVDTENMPITDMELEQIGV